MLRIRLFGGFEVLADGVPVVLTSSRAQSLLAHLVLHRDVPQRREHLAFLLWPESDERQARTNLRHVLHTLRATVPGVDHHLLAAARTLVWRGGDDDVAAFEAASQRGDLAALREAADLYTGDLLDGAADEWLLPERERLRSRAYEVCLRLVELHESRDELAEAVRRAEQARALDPLDEAAYRALMRLHDRRGDHARAVRTYHACVAVLEEELGVEPSAETRAVFDGLLPGAQDAPRAGGVVPLVGRRAERTRLTECWRDAAAGRAQLVVLTGEPGIGKTRLVEAFRQWAAHEGAVTASARSYAAEGALAYGPLAAWLREPVVARRRSALSGSHRAALARLLPEVRAPAARDATTSEATADDALSRLRLFDAAVRALLAGPEPVLLVADDVHDADPETLQFVHYLLRAEPDAPLLVVATARLAETDADHRLRVLLARLLALDRCTELDVGRLDPAETGALAERLGHPLGPDDLHRLHLETAGNPLFVVEALRAGWTGDGSSGVLTPKVQAVIETRFLQLSDSARDLLGLAAAAGRSVPVDVLVRCRASDEDRLARELDELWRRQLLVAAGGDTYDFSHDVVRKVAYRGLSPARRRHHHRTLAGALQEVHAARLDDVAGQIAAHLHEAGSLDEAAEWYRRAADAAQRLFADADTARLLHRAWEAGRAGPSSTARLTRELEILTALPGPLAAAEGYASARLAAVLDRAFELSDQLDVEPAAPLLRARAMAVLSRSDFDAALRYGAELHARGADDAVMAVEGDFVRGVAELWRGKLDTARMHLTAAISGYRQEDRRAHLASFGQDPQALCLVRLAQVELASGDPDLACGLRDRALSLARAIGQPFTLTAVLVFAALIELDLEPDLADAENLRAWVAELEILRHRVEAPPIRLNIEALAGLVAVLDGRVEEGLARIDAALADPGRRTAPGLPAMMLRSRLAACEHAGLLDDAAATARRLLDEDVRYWDGRAGAVLTRLAAQ